MGKVDENKEQKRRSLLILPSHSLQPRESPKHLFLKLSKMPALPKEPLSLF